MGARQLQGSCNDFINTNNGEMIAGYKDGARQLQGSCNDFINTNNGEMIAGYKDGTRQFRVPAMIS